MTVTIRLLFSGLEKATQCRLQQSIVRIPESRFATCETRPLGVHSFSVGGNKFANKRMVRGALSESESNWGNQLAENCKRSGVSLDLVVVERLRKIVHKPCFLLATYNDLGNSYATSLLCDSQRESFIVLAIWDNWKGISLPKLRPQPPGNPLFETILRP